MKKYRHVTRNRSLVAPAWSLRSCCECPFVRHADARVEYVGVKKSALQRSPRINHSSDIVALQVILQPVGKRRGPVRDAARATNGHRHAEASFVCTLRGQQKKELVPHHLAGPGDWIRFLDNTSLDCLRPDWWTKQVCSIMQTSQRRCKTECHRFYIQDMTAIPGQAS
jgi:hypothetical protein